MPIKAKDISIIIPVKNNQRGIDEFFSQFFAEHGLASFPAEVIIVDNNSAIPIKIQESFKEYGLSIQLLTCVKPGPAAARNTGGDHAQGEWLLFVDSDCVPTATFISGYLSAIKSESAKENSPVGYQGSVGAVGDDAISNYYVSQQILRPPKLPDCTEGSIPMCLVSANILILRSAFQRVDGFNDDFLFVGGEDIDFGLRLSEIGQLKYAPNALVLHCFDDGLVGFIRRFFAYGKGNRCVIEHHSISLLPLPFTAKNKTILVNHLLALLQWLCLLAGYAVQTVEFRLAGRRK